MEIIQKDDHTTIVNFKYAEPRDFEPFSSSTPHSVSSSCLPIYKQEDEIE